MGIRKFGTGDGEIIGTPVTEDDEQGISTTATRQVEQEPWTEQDAAELAAENEQK